MVVADIIRKITENHPVKNAADWGLHLHSTGACLDEAKSLAFYKLRVPTRTRPLSAPLRCDGDS